jgi:uncharacterized membrane protein
MEMFKHLRTLADLILIAIIFTLFVFLGVAMFDPACGASGDSQIACTADIVRDLTRIFTR